MLSASDYKIPSPGQTWDPTNPKQFVSKAVGAIVALSFLFYLGLLAFNRGAPALDSALGSLTNGLLSTEEQDYEVF